MMHEQPFSRPLRYAFGTTDTTSTNRCCRFDKARDLVQDRDEVAVRASPGPAAMATGKRGKRGKPTAAVAVETIGTG